MENHDDYLAQTVMDIERELAQTTSPQFMENPEWKRRSIYRLSNSFLTEQNKNAHNPQVVSLGPYHHGNPFLFPMEEHKRRAVAHFVKRSGKTLSLFVKALADRMDRLLDAYYPRAETYSDVQLFLFDGCFILEILGIFTGIVGSYPLNDPVFSNHGIVYVMPYIKRDMLIIENQVPMEVLYTLAHVEDPKQSKEFINTMLAYFFFQNNHRIRRQVEQYPEYLHGLDLCHKVWVGADKIEINTNFLLRNYFCSRLRKYIVARFRHTDEANRNRGNITTPSVMEIHQSGIQVKSGRSPSLKDIAFHRHVVCGATLQLPPITVDGSTETMLLNLLAFERLHAGAGRDVTNFLVFMNNIIRDPEDVSYLCSCGIIQNDLGRDEVVANLFNSISKDFGIDPDSSVYDVNFKVSSYCKRKSVRWRANVVRTYFSSPWAIISVIASMSIFTFTLAQTGFAIISYYQKK